MTDPVEISFAFRRLCSAAHGVVQRVAYIGAVLGGELVETLKHRLKVAFQDSFRVILIQHPAELVDAYVDVAAAAGHAYLFNETLLRKTVDDFREVASRDTETVRDAGHVFAAFFVLKEVFQHLNLRIGIRDSPKAHLFRAVHAGVDVAVVDQRFDYLAVFAHP